MSHPPSIPPLLSVSELTISFGNADAVKGISFHLNAGEIAGIVGESGSGKSVTCRALMGLLPNTAGVAGRVALNGCELLGLEESEWASVRGAEMGMIFQNPASHLDPLRRIGDQIAAPLVRHLGIARREAKRRAVGLLQDTGIREPALRARAYPHEFSGGMKQRAMIAAAIGCGPKLLIADEPTTALDVTVPARILKLLKDINRDRGLAILLISHDLSVIADICSRVIVMRHGEIVEQGLTEHVINRPHHAYTKLLIDSQPGRRSFAGSKTFMASPPPLLRVENLTVSFAVRRGISGALSRTQDRILALNGVSLHVAAGETVGVVGESGSGKSTLARAIVRHATPSGGSVLLEGQDVHALNGEALLRFRRSVQMVFQNPYDSLNPRMTIREAVAEPIWRHGLADKRRAEIQADELLGMVELPDTLHDRKPRQLSGGQCQRVGIARSLALQPKLLIADEITSALDVTTQAQILKLLSRLQRERGLALIYISHDLSVVGSFCQRVYVFKEGRITESGAAQEVLTAPRDPYTQELVNSLARLRPEHTGVNS